MQMEYTQQTRGLSPAQTIHSYDVFKVCKLRKAVQKLSASTYQVVSDWKYKKKNIDVEIERLSNKVSRFKNEEDEFKFVNEQLHLLYTQKDDEKKLLGLVEELIAKRRDFTELKNDNKFSKSNKINLFCISFFLLNLFANRLQITENANYPIITFVAAAFYFTGSMSYWIIWKKCCFQPSVKDQAEKLRKIARNVYREFSPKPPILNPDLQHNQFNPQMQYQALLNEREKERELKKAKKNKVLKITDGKIIGSSDL